jgi:uncharacterized repeat protein (TIGR03803 family)
LFDGAKTIGTATVGTTGTWSVTPAKALSAGVHVLTASESSASGVSAKSAAFKVTIKVSAAAPSGLAFAVAADKGASGDTIRVSGRGEAGGRVSLLDGAKVIGTRTVTGSGGWSLTTAKPLAVGAHSLRASEVDVAGNKSKASPAQSLSLLRAAPNRAVFVGSAGKDQFTGGGGSDVFKFTAAALSASDVVRGGAGADYLTLISAGTVRAGGVAGVETWHLAGAAANNLSLANGNFAGAAGATVTVVGGANGNRLSEAAVSAADSAILRGGAGADILIAGRHAVMTGGGGNDRFELTLRGSPATPDRNTIADFTHGADKLGLSETGFGLGTAPAAASLFRANPTGAFTTAAQRFAYSTATGVLRFDADGSGHASSPLTIATLGGHPTLGAADLFFFADTPKIGSIRIGDASQAANAAKTVAATAITPVLTTLVSFNSANGAVLTADLMADGAGDLFGTTLQGGANGYGTVFEIAKTGGGYARAPTTLASFNGANGIYPAVGLIADAAGDLFGTTLWGGASSDGTVFEIAKTGGRYASAPTTLVSFNGADGLEPPGYLIADAAGDLFGTTAVGGANNDGTVFELVNHGVSYTLKTLVSFNDANGRQSQARLIADAAGDLFGTTVDGGAKGYGTVFEIAKTGGRYASAPTTLVSFNGANGKLPHAGLIADAAGNLFGTTAGSGAEGDSGTVFELSGAGFHVRPSGLALAASSDSGVKGDRITNVTKPTITGKGEAGVKVTLHDGTKIIGTAMVAKGGAWSVTPVTALAAGVRNLTAIGSGPTWTSGSSAPFRLTIKASAPAPSALAFSVSADKGALGDTIRVTGKGEAGDRVSLFDGAKLVGTAKVAAGGAWSIATAKPLAIGVHSLTASETDVAGNKSKATPAQSLALVRAAPNRAVFVGTSGQDQFIGGGGSDVFRFTASALAASDVVKGGAGADYLTLTSAGTVRAGGVAGIETWYLAGTAANSLSLVNGNFAGAAGATITVAAGGKGDSLSEAAVSAADRAILRGGAGADILIAGRHAALTGGGGNDRFELTVRGSPATPDRNTIADFEHGADKLGLAEAGFGLGTAPVAATLFRANPTGAFTTAAQRFAYNSATGVLRFDADGKGSGSSPLTIATLGGHPTLSAGDLFFFAGASG